MSPVRSATGADDDPSSRRRPFHSPSRSHVQPPPLPVPRSATALRKRPRTDVRSAWSPASSESRLNRPAFSFDQFSVLAEDVGATDIDAFYAHMALRWGRNSLHRSATVVRAWFRYCETRGHARPGLAATILLPRIYRDEALPMGPTWDTVGRILANTSGDDPVSIRSHAIILLLAVYGLRSGEVRHLRLNDIDWLHNRIRFIRSKSRRREEAPLEARVGNAIARYLCEVRPQTSSRFVFLRLRAPYKPLSVGGLYHVVAKYFPEHERPRKGCGPHGLRHACARHLLESGKSFKEVGDHLGHRSPDTTRIYAKVNLSMLRQVASDDLGGLA